MSRSLTRSNLHHPQGAAEAAAGCVFELPLLGLGQHDLRKARTRLPYLGHRDNEYIDYRLGYGPSILGYADPRADAAARAGIEVGGVFALSTEREYEVARRISKMVPAAELVRFSNSGTEAVMAALRLAKAHTGNANRICLWQSWAHSFVRAPGA